MPMWTRSWSTLADSLCEPAHLPVGNRNARGSDEHEAGDAGDPELPVRSVALPPATERERAENAADQPADVTADRDVSAARVVCEADREVDHDERDRVAAEELSRRRPFDHGHRAEDAEDRAGRANGDALVRIERPGRPCQATHDEQGEEPCAAEILLDGSAEPPECKHVEADGKEARGQPPRRERAPPFAGGDPAVKREVPVRKRQRLAPSEKAELVEN